MSYVKLWVHAVWSTKNRAPCLSRSIRQQLFAHIKENAREKGIYIDTLNGHLDHVHCLLALNADMPIAKHLNLLKGESARWANMNNLVQRRLEWSNEYFAVSVSESLVDKVRHYIQIQEEHHKKLTFAQEYEKFIKQYKFKVQN